jgi:hypothetical protein
MAYTLDQAKEKVSGYTQPKYGRAPNSEQEWASIAQGINYDDGVDDAELGQAYGNADRLAASYGVSPAPASQPAASATPPASSVPVPSNLQNTVGNLFQEAPASPIQGAFQDSLLSVLQQTQQPVSLTDPNLQSLSDLNRLGAQRATERARAAMAERAAASGTSGSGGFDRGVERLLNQEGRAVTEFDTNLIRGEQLRRQQQLMQALQLAQATGNQEAARRLQTQLALLSEATSESQFGRELGFREGALEQQGQLGRGDLALRLLLGLMGNQYNYDALGSSNAFRMADLNQNYLQSLLSGGY